MDLVKLKAEILSDPASIGYAGKGHEHVARILNQPGRTADVETVTGGQLLAAMAPSEWDALAAGEKAYLSLVFAAGELPVTRNLRKKLLAVFGAGSDTRKAWVDLLKRPASRAEELGLGRVTESNVADALLRT